MMCPRCDEHLGCQYWDLKDSCNLAKVKSLPLQILLCIDTHVDVVYIAFLLDPRLPTVGIYES